MLLERQIQVRQQCGYMLVGPPRTFNTSMHRIRSGRGGRLIQVPAGDCQLPQYPLESVGIRAQVALPGSQLTVVYA
jgi:hypothetical protein